MGHKLKQILLYLPVIHKGYDALFERHRDVDEILLMGGGFAEVFPAFAKDTRALSPASAANYLRLIVDARQIKIVEPGDLPGAVVADELIMPDEAMMRELTTRYELQKGRNVTFETTFLHWDREWSRPGRPEGFEGRIVAEGVPQRIMQEAQRVGRQSSDWWRHVGAIAVRGDDILGRASGRHHPTEYSAYIDGDPRDGFSRGVRADLSSASHAEANIVAEAARKGVSLRDADLYVTTFPCPTCAQLIVAAGFSRCFFSGPYSVPDGDDLLRRAGIEVIWVDIETDKE
jgi:dCMP deaminase